MQHIEDLIENLWEEGGWVTELRVTFDGGWNAMLVDSESDEVILCPAGEMFLSTRNHHTPNEAIAVLEKRIAQGLKKMEEELSGLTA